MYCFDYKKGMFTIVSRRIKDMLLVLCNVLGSLFCTLSRFFLSDEKKFPSSVSDPRSRLSKRRFHAVPRPVCCGENGGDGDDGGRRAGWAHVVAGDGGVRTSERGQLVAAGGVHGHGSVDRLLQQYLTAWLSSLRLFIPDICLV